MPKTNHEVTAAVATILRADYSREVFAAICAIRNAISLEVDNPIHSEVMASIDRVMDSAYGANDGTWRQINTDCPLCKGRAPIACYQCGAR